MATTTRPSARARGCGFELSRRPSGVPARFLRSDNSNRPPSHDPLAWSAAAASSRVGSLSGTLCPWRSSFRWVVSPTPPGVLPNARRGYHTSTRRFRAASQDDPELGPLGRPVLTPKTVTHWLRDASQPNLSGLYELIQSDPSSKKPNDWTVSGTSPKLVWNQASKLLGCAPAQYRHEVIAMGDGNPLLLHQLTALTVLPKPEGDENSLIRDCYEALLTHPHVGSRPGYDWVELVTVGTAPTKKLAGHLAALDAMVLWHAATGIDPTKLPEEMLRVANEHHNTIGSTKNDPEFQAQLAKAQNLVELLRCTPVRYDAEWHDETDAPTRGYWTADAETYWKGQYYCSSGLHYGPNGDVTPRFKARSKKEARQRALVALMLDQNRDTPLGIAAQKYDGLLESNPHVGALRIPGWKPGIAQKLRVALDGLGSDSGAIESETNRRETIMPSSNTKPRRKTKSPEAVKAISASLWDREQTKLERAASQRPSAVERIDTARARLPIANLRANFLEALAASPVVLIEAGTGSGKSTQVPQYLLEEGLSNQQGAKTRILVTQPRRIAAQSLAERVATERFEDALWKKAKPNNARDGTGRSRRSQKRRKLRAMQKDRSVGYSVRFDAVLPRRHGGSIEFCTTGLLLRRLLRNEGNDALAGISHVLLDEVHERDVNTDLLLVLLRDRLRQQRAANPHNEDNLKVVLLSATLEAHSLREYFAPVLPPGSKGDSTTVPLLSIPSKPLHPVETVYLEDLLGNTDAPHEFPPKLQELAAGLLDHNDAVLRQKLASLTTSSEDASHQTSVLEKALSLRNSSPLGLEEEDDGDEAFCFDLEEDADPLLSKKEFRSTVAGLVSELALHLSQREIDKFQEGSTATKGGSILCFLPGMDEIKDCKIRIEDDCPPELAGNITILPLHSEIPHQEQAKVFRPAQAGTVKVILSTNIAESSLTIDDVLAVVDSGLVKEASFDVASSGTTIETQSISKASASQRLGRAGRVAPGSCYRLYSRSDHEAMEAKMSPEIQRTCLESTCLQVCSLLEDAHGDYGSVGEFLASTMDPPPEDSVRAALEKLVAVGAIAPTSTGSIGNSQSRERLTPLGEFLVRLPLDPSIGKMLVVAAVTKCLDPLLTAAAWMGGGQIVFSHPVPELRRETADVQRSFSETSDITGIVSAYESFWDVYSQEGWNAANDWAREHFINPSAMVTMKAIRKQLLKELVATGLVHSKDVTRGELRLGATSNRHGNCQLLVEALLCTAMPRNLAVRRKTGRFGNLATASETEARLHPSSVLYRHKSPSGKNEDDAEGGAVVPEWYSYRHKVETSNIFLRGCSAIIPEQILLFGGSQLVQAERNKTGEDNSSIRGIIDGWIAIESSSDRGSCIGEETSDLVMRARESIGAIVSRKLLWLSRKHSRSSHPLPDNSGKMIDDYEFEDEDNRVIDGIRELFDNLETGRIPEPEPKEPSNDDFHDYFLETKLDR